MSNYRHFFLWLQGNAHGTVISLKYVNYLENGKEWVEKQTEIVSFHFRFKINFFNYESLALV